MSLYYANVNKLPAICTNPPTILPSLTDILARKCIVQFPLVPHPQNPSPPEARRRFPRLPAAPARSWKSLSRGFASGNFIAGHHSAQVRFVLRVFLTKTPRRPAHTGTSRRNHRSSPPSRTSILVRMDESSLSTKCRVRSCCQESRGSLAAYHQPVKRQRHKN
jgi:hypothetical protein